MFHYHTFIVLFFCVFHDTISESVNFTDVILKSEHEAVIQYNSSISLSDSNSFAYRLSAPQNHKIHIECQYEGPSDNDTNQNEYLYIVTDHTWDHSGGQFFGTGNITTETLFNYGVIMLKNTNASELMRGYFECTVAAQKSKTCECGWGLHSKIVNGDEANPIEFPSNVAFVHIPSNDMVFCGGTIIHHRYILTAAHCFIVHVYTNPIEVDILVGVHNAHNRSLSKYTQAHKLQHVIQHRYYRTSDQDNDIALVKTANDMIFSRGVGPACLPYKYLRTTFFDDEVQITGWGAVSWGGKLSDVLRKVSLSVLDTDVCGKRIIWVNKKKICTYTPDKDACQSDSGGPVYYTNGRKYIVGIVSFGIKCATDAPGVNTRVTSYLRWINTVIGQANLCH